MEIIRKDSSSDSNTDSGDEVFWECSSSSLPPYSPPSPPSPTPVNPFVRTFPNRPTKRPPPPPPPVASAPPKNALFSNITSRFKKLDSNENQGITRATSLNPSTRQVYNENSSYYGSSYYKPKQLWEYEDEEGLKYAIAKYMIDQKICQIAQRGLSYAHANPVQFTVKSCLEWMKELEDDYFKKNGEKYEYEPIKIDDQVKNDICRTKEYKFLIQLGSKIVKAQVA